MWKTSDFTPPWESNRKPIFAFIKEHTENGTRSLSKEGQNLPDDSVFYEGKRLCWGAGAMDGVFGHHVGKGEQGTGAGTIRDCLEKVLCNPSEQNVSLLYKELLSEDVLSFIDELIPIVASDERLDYGRLVTFMRWLTTNAPDRCPVKVGIALLGIFQGGAFTELFLTLGCHEEFTLYASVALCNSLENAERELWQLAKKVDGWGRISDCRATCQDQQRKHYELDVARGVQEFDNE